MSSIFIKSNPFDNDSLIKEVKGLNLIKENLLKSNNNYLKIPEIISVNKNEIQMKNIETSFENKNLIENLALGLAKLHEQKNRFYGLEYDNYIGLNPQKNIISNNWGEFFTKFRLAYQISLIKDKEIKQDFENFLDENLKKIEKFLNETTSYASLVHGDLWSGNVLFSKDDVYLIDPAVYYADREVDIAMTELFGGFNNTFYEIYNTYLPLSKSYNIKKIIYNLYHYLNHYNLFGNSYLNSCVSSLKFINEKI